MISGTTGLTKAGAATLVLTGDNTYKGATNLAGGTLVVNGNQAGSAVAVASGATLAGTGATGAVRAGAGAMVAPGDPTALSPIGTLRVASLDLTGGGTLLTQLAGQGFKQYDRLDVAGTLTLDAASRLVLDTGGLTGSAKGIVTYAGRTGAFGSVTTTAPKSRVVELMYKPTSLDVQVR